MKIRLRQSGSVLLIAIVFLVIVGALFAASAVNLVTVSSIGEMAVHTGNVTLAAARSGLQYGAYMRKNTPWSQALVALTYPGYSGELGLCSITVTEPVLTSTTYLASISYSSTISSSALCSVSTSYQGTRLVSMTVTGMHDTLLSLDSYQPVPNQ